MPRKKIDKLTAFVKDYGAKGLAYIAIQEDGTWKSSFAKFMSEEEMSALVKAMDGEPGDLLLFAADKNKVVWDVSGSTPSWSLRNSWIFWIKMNTALYGLQNSRSLSGAMSRDAILPCIIRLPCPWKRICPYLDAGELGKVRAKAYDIVLNGNEIGGGSVRIHQDDIQEKMFEALGFTKEQAHEPVRFPA